MRLDRHYISMPIHKYRNKSLRLKGYDYSKAGLYFITICCQNMIHRFGKIENKTMILNDAGKMISEQWLALEKRFTNIQLHEYIIMPNHFHGIIEIKNVQSTLVVDPNDEKLVRGTGQPQGIAHKTIPQKTIGDMMDAFKSITTVEYIRGVKNFDWPRFEKKLWQSNYWERIIRDWASYGRIAMYIENNPSRWKHDTLNA